MSNDKLYGKKIEVQQKYWEDLHFYTYLSRKQYSSPKNDDRKQFFLNLLFN